ncbi:MAG: hypothetical protein HQK57_02270 [Deltaproteobacteria bacterium]|nr:hypothetical protein [Deltaproteobacteria bacterium]
MEEYPSELSKLFDEINEAFAAKDRVKKLEAEVAKLKQKLSGIKAHRKRKQSG